MAHEDLARSHSVEGSSERSFGLVMAGAFVVIAAWPLMYAQAPRWWACAVALPFAAAALLKPALLVFLNRWWLRLGLLLGRAASPIALGILYFAVLTPISVLMRAAGKDSLRLKRRAGAASHWVPREPPGPPPDSMTNQF